MIRAAIGLDFNEVSFYGKVFRILQYITEILLVVGCVALIFKRKQFNITNGYMAGIICSIILLCLSIFVPYFNIMTITTTRLYAITLFFIAPLVTIGAEVFKIKHER